jgi:hypothetical protein
LGAISKQDNAQFMSPKISIKMRLTLLLTIFILRGTCLAQSFISRADAINDIDFYTKTLQEVHYNPFLFIKKEKFFSEVEILKKSITDSISANKFIILLYRISGLVKDGHNAPYLVQPVIIDQLKKEQFFPFKLIIEKDRLYVPRSTSIASGLPAGSEIISINNVSIRKIMPEIENFIGGSKVYSTEMAEKLLSYFLFLNDIAAPFNIQYIDTLKNKNVKVIQAGLKFKDALAVTMPHLKNEYTFKIIENKLGYIDFMSMSGDLNKFGQFLDSSFNVMKSSKITNLAIDIRRNSGGNSTLGDLLFSYINTGKYSLMGGRMWKVSTQYKKYLLLNGDSTNNYLKRDNGSIWELGDCKPQENRFKNDSNFKGKVYLITGPFTFSSANMIADGAKQYRIAEIIGTPTGENTNDFGEAYVFILPNSQIKMQTTTSFDFGADCNRNTHLPVMPDILIGYNFNEKIYEKDKALEYILNHLK